MKSRAGMIEEQLLRENIRKAIKLTRKKKEDPYYTQESYSSNQG